MAASSDPRVVVVGAPGQVGTDLMRAMAEWAPVGLSHADLEVTDAGAVETRLEALAPEVVVNCAAFHQVDACERRPDEAFRVNALGALHVARACARLGALAVYVSTDYVFGGDLHRPYSESDLLRPVNVYGVSKVAGEMAVAAVAPRHLIVRVASVFGVAGARGKGGNFVETMLGKARGGEPIRVVDDLMMSPTYAADAAAAVRRMIAGGHTGIVHAANTGACTWFGLAQAIFAMVGLKADLRPQRSADLAGAAPRPRNSALEPGRLAALGQAPPPWQDGLRRYLVAKGHLTG